MYSKRFLDLVAEIRNLRRSFLPAEFSATGTYTDAEHDRARGFVVLCHAEIEHYLETVCLTKVRASKAEWDAKKKPSVAAISLMACHKADWSIDEIGETPIELGKVKSVDVAVEDVLDRALKQYVHLVGKNNGVKEDNIRRLVLPLGIRLSELDATWLGSLTSFGQARGDIAHKSRLELSTKLDPKSELQSIVAILRGLRQVDRKIAAL